MLEKKRLILALSCLLVSGFISAFILWRGGTEQAASLPRELPINLEGWQGRPFMIAMPKETEPEDYILRAYERNDGQNLKMLAFYSRISDYHRPSICYRGAGHQLTEVPFLGSSSGRIKLAGLMGKRDGQTILVYHGFFIGNRIVPDGMKKKLYEMKDKLTRGYVDQYFFEVLVEVIGNDQTKAVSTVRRFLSDAEPYLIHSES